MDRSYYGNPGTARWFDAHPYSLGFAWSLERQKEILRQNTPPYFWLGKDADEEEGLS